MTSFQKAKVVFDPSDNYLPKKFKKDPNDSTNSSRKNDSDPSSPETNPVGRPPAQKSAIRDDLKRKEPEEQCSICSKYEQKRLKLLIFCSDCNYRGELQTFQTSFNSIFGFSKCWFCCKNSQLKTIFLLENRIF